MTTAREELLKIINTANNLAIPLTDENVILGTPIAENASGKNTYVVISTIPTKGYFNEVGVRYNRIDLSAIVPETQWELRTNNTTDLHSALVDINAKYGTYLVAEDVINETFPSMVDDDVVEVSIIAENDSIGWIGSRDITIYKGLYYLQEEVTTLEYNLFNHYENTAGKVSGRMATWGIDFTPYLAQLAISEGAWVSFSNVLGVCYMLGIPAWADGPVSDHATSEIADANPAFDRVLIQSTVVSSGITGPLYFHYDVL